MPSSTKNGPFAVRLPNETRPLTSKPWTFSGLNERIDQVLREERPPRKGAIAFLDSLGTKGTGDPALRLKHWAGIAELARHMTEQLSQGALGVPSSAAAFSDTIVLTYEIEDDIEALSGLGQAINLLYAASVNVGILLRGALTYGDFYRDGIAVVGPAVDEVADWYERPDWIGVILTPSASTSFDWAESVGWNLAPHFTKYDVPLGSEGRERRRLWVPAWPHVFGASKAETPMTEIYNLLSKQPIPWVASSKFVHTVEFAQKVLEAPGSRT